MYMLKHISWAEYEREWNMFFCLSEIMQGGNTMESICLTFALK